MREMLRPVDMARPGQPIDYTEEAPPEHYSVAVFCLNCRQPGKLHVPRGEAIVRDTKESGTFAVLDPKYHCQVCDTGNLVQHLTPPPRPVEETQTAPRSGPGVWTPVQTYDDWARAISLRSNTEFQQERMNVWVPDQDAAVQDPRQEGYGFRVRNNWGSRWQYGDTFAADPAQPSSDRSVRSLFTRDADSLLRSTALTMPLPNPGLMSHALFLRHDGEDAMSHIIRSMGVPADVFAGGTELSHQQVHEAMTAAVRTSAIQLSVPARVPPAEQQAHGEMITAIMEALQAAHTTRDEVDAAATDP